MLRQDFICSYPALLGPELGIYSLVSSPYI